MKNSLLKGIIIPVLILFTIMIHAQNYHVYVSSASMEDNAGIYRYSFNENKGNLKFMEKVGSIKVSSYLNTSSDGKYLYSVGNGKVIAFSVSDKTGNLTLINSQPVTGGPCYVSVDKTGKWIFIANYGGGTINIFPFSVDTGLGNIQQTIQHKGSSVNKKRQKSAHPHMILPSPDNKFVLVTDLGADKIFIYPFDEKTGLLDESHSSFIKSAPGSGPRHFEFHPNGKSLYVLNELLSTVTAYNWDKINGKLSEIKTEELLPEDFMEFNKSADIHITPDGHFLYASNRGHNSITAFEVKKDGMLNFIHRFPSGGDFPRNFYISPGGNYLLVANKHSGNIIVYKINKQNAILSKKQEIKGIASPQCIKFIKK
jgi:6-phosphogluconolactonase